MDQCQVFWLHDELEWLTKAGFTRVQSLQTATINAARFLEREASEGTIEVGKRANLVLLGADLTQPALESTATTRASTVGTGRMKLSLIDIFPTNSLS